jgi:2-phospho-L-lactate guanylyltransferase
MRATAIVPVKRFDEAKRRLSGTEAEAHRPALVRAMLADVLLGLNESRLVDRIVVVSGEPAVTATATEAGAEQLDDPADAGHSEAAGAGIADAIARGDECAALIAADCPLLDSVELDRELDAQAPGVAVIPDRHGSGTNGLILTPPDAIRPAFGPGSRERHLELARAAGVRCRIATVPSMALDLDTGEDLRKLVLALAADPERAPATAAALQQLGETGI